MTSRINKRYNGFLKTKTKPELTLQCCFSTGFSSEGENVTIRHTDKNSLYIARSDFNCSISDNSGSVSMRRSIYSFDAFLRVLYSIILTDKKGFLLHSAGVVLGKKGHLFPGPSGSGKTTVARLSLSSGIVLNDEIIACRIFKKKTVKIYGTPFWGEMRKGLAHNIPCSLKGLYFLNKSKKRYKKSISRETALKKLLKCCCTFSKDIKDMEEVVNTCISLINCVTSYSLHFKKDSSLWEII